MLELSYPLAQCCTTTYCCAAVSPLACVQSGTASVSTHSATAKLCVLFVAPSGQGQPSAPEEKSWTNADFGTPEFFEWLNTIPADAATRLGELAANSLQMAVLLSVLRYCCIVLERCPAGSSSPGTRAPHFCAGYYHRTLTLRLLVGCNSFVLSGRAPAPVRGAHC